MGVDCNIYLPPGTRLSDVKDVIGILAGKKPEKSFLRTGSAGWYVHVSGVNVNHFGVNECVAIDFGDEQGQGRYCTYHFEHKSGMKHIIARSNTYWLAMGRRLVGFFGGYIDYSDHDLVDNNYEVTFRDDIHAEDDQPWQDFQERKFNVAPLTIGDFNYVRPYADFDGRDDKPFFKRILPRRKNEVLRSASLS